MSSGGLLDDQFRDTQIGTTASPGLGFTLLGESVTHRTALTPGVTPVSTAITAIRIPTPDVVESDTDEQTKWLVSAADLSSDPEDGDTITDDATIEWGVVRVTPQEGGVFVLTCIHTRDR